MITSSSRRDTELRSIVSPYAGGNRRDSLAQLATSIGPFIAVCAASYLAYPHSWLISLALALPAGGLLLRIFAIQHDCTHGSFFASQRANRWAGRACSLVTLTPFATWRRLHLLHHGTWNDLHRSDLSDIYSACLTVSEYRALPPARRLLYRLPRHPLFAIVLLPPLIFLLLFRLPFDTPRELRRERRSVWLTDLGLALLYGALALLLGWERVLVVQLPALIVGSFGGAWMLSLQHHFEGARWATPAEWDYVEVSLAGSSWLALPGVLHWFTGNLGFHHVHHLNPRIPNYHLRAAHEALQPHHPAQPLGLGGALRGPWLALWDEEARRLVSIRQAAA
jgi:omega-6 fatty acid desaturase (delta-12 desaturase)